MLNVEGSSPGNPGNCLAGLRKSINRIVDFRAENLTLSFANMKQYCWPLDFDVLWVVIENSKLEGNFMSC
jgi:hypothetical protein